MVSFDPKSNAYVLRIAFDGPSNAGKTTSLRSFAEQVDRPTWTPAEDGGRTLYFDWASFEGGSVDGRKLRCHPP